MSISLLSSNQNFLQLLQYSGISTSAYPMMNMTQLIVGNSANTTSGMIDGASFAVSGDNTLSQLLSNNSSNLNSLFNQLA